MSELINRVFEISFNKKLSHLSSNISACGIIDAIYTEKTEEDIFVLSSGHAGLALYVNLEKHEGKDAEKLYDKHGTHPNRCIEDGIHVSSGSLGCGITIALGMAMANPLRKVHCLISDGEMWEGSVYESLMLKQKFGVNNLIIHVNSNGFSCLGKVDSERIEHILSCLDPKINIWATDWIYSEYPFLNGVEGHYYNLKLRDLL